MRTNTSQLLRPNASARPEVAPVACRATPFRTTRTPRALATSPAPQGATSAHPHTSISRTSAAASSPVSTGCPSRGISWPAVRRGRSAHTAPRPVTCACTSGGDAPSSDAPSVSAASDAAPAATAAAAVSRAPSGAPFWKTHISRKPLLVQALLDCLAGIRRGGPLPDTVDVALVYVSSEYLEDYGVMVETLRKELPGLRNVFGCTGFGVIGVDEEGAHEVEAQPALSLTLATLPQAEVVVRHLDERDLPDGDAPPDRWSSLLGVPAFPEAPLSVIVLSDPSFSAVQDLLDGLDFAFPTATKIGGLSSSSAFGGSRTATFCWSASPESTRAAPTTTTTTTTTTASSALDPPGRANSSNPLGSAALGSGAPGSGSGSGSGPGSGVRLRGASVLCLHGEVQMDLMIAQGCRPLTSTTWTVDRVAPGAPTHVVALSSETVARGRSLPALEAFQIELQSVLSGMSEGQLRRTVANLTVGVAPEGLKKSLEPQDFLIRALRGFDAEQCLVVGEHMRVGQRVRFMVRDKQGAQEDLASHGLSYKRRQLQAMLQGDSPEQLQATAPFGMLMFTCNGRGSGLYGEDSYDARTMSSYLPVPCAGFQCNGEIGRVGDTTHLHGFTCAVGVLRLTAADVPATAPGAPSAAGAAASTPPVPQPPPPSPEDIPEQQQQQQ